MLIRFLRYLPLGLLLCATSESAGAQNIDYTFTGVITTSNSPTGLFSPVQVGDPFTVTVTIDSLAAGSGVFNFMTYADAVLAADLDIGGITSTPTLIADPSAGVRVGDDVGFLMSNDCEDSFTATGYPSSGFEWFSCSLRETDSAPASCPTVWSTADIPLSLNIGDFNSAGFSLRTAPGGSPQIAGTITNVTETPIALNDDCANATALPSSFADTPYNATGATTDGADSAGFCNYGAFGDDQSENDVWFTYTPTVGGCTYISTFGLAGYDTRLAVYRGTACPDDPANIIACADEEVLPSASPFEAGLDVVLEGGVTYLIRLGTFSQFDDASDGVLRIAAGPGAAANSGGNNPGAPGCGGFLSFCNGDGGDQMGCTDCPCFNNASNGTIGGCLNSAGTGARLIGSGSPSVSSPPNSLTDLRFALSGAPPLSFCILNSGDALAPGNMANPCFGLGTGGPAAVFDGLRCAITNTRRHGGRQADANGDVGILNFPWGGEGGPPLGIANAGGGFAAGVTRFFQAINRDNPLLSCMRALNTSQALKVTFTP